MSNLHGLWITVLNMSISASYVALGVMLIRFLLARIGAPRTFAYVLWAAVLIRLVVPVSFTASFSLLGLTRSEPARDGATMAYVPYDLGLMEEPAVHVGSSSLNGAAGSLPPRPAEAASINPMQIVMALLDKVWLAGVAALLLYSVTSYLAVLRRVRTATRVRGNIWETDRIDAPFVCGFIRPKIYVPLGLSAEQLTCVEAHEQTHIQRFDHIVKPFAFAVLAVHWFNPLMWFAYRLMTRDMEISCDEKAIRKLGSFAREGYSRALLELSERRSGLPVGSLPAFGESSVRSRIEHVLHYQRSRLRVVIPAIVLTAGVLAACLANPKPESNSEASGSRAERLLANRTRYIGDNSKDYALLGALAWPLGTQYQGFQLKTSSKPYGMTVRFNINDDYSRQVPQLTEATWKANAIILLSLIDNAEVINFAITSPYYGTGTQTYTRTEADAVLGTDVRSFASDPASFEDFLQRLKRTLEASPVKLTGPTVGWGGWVQPAPTAANWGGDPEELIAARTGYDNALSTDIAFVVALSWPHGARRGYLNLDNGASMNYSAPATFDGIQAGATHKAMKIANPRQPRKIDVGFDVEDAAFLPAQGLQDSAWKANAIILFSLIDDVDVIKFSVGYPMPEVQAIKGPGGPGVRLSYTRAEADAALGVDVRTFAKDPASVSDLLRRLEGIAGKPTD